MSDLVSCGFLILKPRADGSSVPGEFLLMEHADRWDLPKGHVDAGETEMECALRELWEETGIHERDIDIDPGFRFVHKYIVCNERTGGEPRPKTLVIFLGRLHSMVDIRPTEHAGYCWFPWSPPHAIQLQTIDPLLAAVEQAVNMPPKS